MRPTTRRLVSIVVLILVLSLLGFVLALIFQWPSQFTLDQAADSNVTIGDIVNGTVTSIPLLPMIVLAAAAALARSRRWWGTVAVVVLFLLGGVIIIGGMGEAFPSVVTGSGAGVNPDVSRAVLLSAGLVFMLLGLTLVVAAVIELADRFRHKP